MKRTPCTTSSPSAPLLAGVLCLLALCLLALAPGARAATTRHDFTFFSGTQYPLAVTFLKGEQDGPTIMVQGGIQGDEPSGYLSAQLLTNAQVERGNLIIVPRANVPSINLRARQVNVDMNRRFDQEYNRFYEDRLARVVRFLLAQSDALIHLHEGSGFYNPTYVDQMRNPMRYGQSIIVDTLSYRGLALGDTVNTVLAELNPGIEPEQYRFKLFNTRTFDENSDYKQMRKSLTCYALTDRGIPALAVEVSKQITQVGWKVHRQLEATLALLHHYGVTARVENIPDDLMETYGAGVGVRINGRPLAPGQVIDLVRGTPLTAETEADPRDSLAPTLALFASDRPGVNMLSAPRLALDTFSDLELRSDGRRVLSAKVRFHGALPGAPAGDGLSFVCWLNGQPVFVRDGQALQAVEGDQLIIEGVWGSSRPEVLNFKGYVACPTANDGQDIGWEIILDPENFIDRYRLDSPAQGTARFQVVRETTGAAKARFFVDVVPRRVHALRLTGPHGQAIMVPWSEGGDYPLPSGDYVLADAWSNGPAGKLVPTAGGLPLAPGSSFRISADAPLEFSVRQATTFANLGTMTFRPSNMASR